MALESDVKAEDKQVRNVLSIIAALIAATSSVTCATAQVFRVPNAENFLVINSGSQSEISIEIGRDRWRHDEIISIEAQTDQPGEMVLVNAPDGWDISDGLISGPLGTPGEISFEIQLIHEGELTSSQPVMITVVGDLDASVPPYTHIEPGQNFSIASSVANALAGVRWTISGDAPSWIELDEESGLISGLAPSTPILVDALLLTVVDQTDLRVAHTDEFSIKVGAVNEPTELVGWGMDANGVVSSIPEDDLTHVVAGLNSAFALKRDGSIIGWGYDGYGKVTGVPQGNGFVAIAGGYNFGLALKSDGSIIGWGQDSFGQASTPQGNDFIAIGAGHNTGFGIRGDGSLAAWGHNNFGQLEVPSGDSFISVVGGERNGYALRSDGSIAAWGDDQFGQVSNVPSGSNFTAISAGANHAYALRLDGSIAAWGYNGFNQVSSVPADADFVSISTSQHHGHAVKRDGTIVGWGQNDSNVISDTPSEAGFIAVVAGVAQVFGIKQPSTQE